MHEVVVDVVEGSNVPCGRGGHPRQGDVDSPEGGAAAAAGGGGGGGEDGLEVVHFCLGGHFPAGDD